MKAENQEMKAENQEMKAEIKEMKTQIGDLIQLLQREDNLQRFSGKSDEKKKKE